MLGGSGGSFWGLVKAKNTSRIDRKCGGRFRSILPFDGHRKTRVNIGYHLKAIPICGDNQGSIFIASNAITEKRSKHIDIHFHYIREVINKGLVTLYFIDGEKNPADLLTLGTR